MMEPVLPMEAEQLPLMEAAADLRSFIIEQQFRSIAIPPLGAGNGGLEWWSAVREQIVSALGDLPDVEIVIFEPTQQYQNVAKRVGVPIRNTSLIR